jgi:D-sedoheptulose 7-phosphate isomerase
MTTSNVVESLLETGRLATELASKIGPDLDAAAALIADSVRAGGKTLACGNGGSAAEAQHFAGEMVGRFLFNRPPAAAIALNTDTSILTAIGNDYGFEKLFARQVEALGRPGDVLMGFSTSGTSPNVLLAMKAAQDRGMKTIAIIGATRPPELETCDVCFCIPSQSTPRIQEMHLAIMHAICERVENRLFSRQK